jgi:hypothetical protein
MPSRILVVYLALQQVRDGFESTVGMIWRSKCLARCIDHWAKFIEKQKRIHQWKVAGWYWPPDHKASTLPLIMRGHNLFDTALI